MHYRISGVHLDSEIELTRAEPASGSAGSDTVRVLLRAAAEPAPVDAWIDERRLPPAPRPWLSVARRNAGYLLRVHAVADFGVDDSGSTIVCVPHPGVTEDVLEQCLVDQVFPQVLHLRGRFAFHASAVGIAAGAVGFLGVSGMGKSTLAASLSSAGPGALPGSSLVCDDCLAVSLLEGRIVVYPSYGEARLWPDAVCGLGAESSRLDSRRTGKRRVHRSPSPDSLRLAALYVLAERDDGVAIEPIHGSELVGVMAAHVHRLDHRDTARLVGELELLTELARQVPVRRLAYPRRYSALDNVKEAVGRDILATIR